MSVVNTGDGSAKSTTAAPSAVTAAPPAISASRTSSPGKDITGRIVSTIVTRNPLVMELPAASVAVTVTIVVPSGNRPDKAPYVTSGFGSTRSTAVATGRVTTAPLGPVAST